MLDMTRGGFLGGDSAGTLIAHVTASSNIADLAIPGLDGNTHERYLLEALIHVSASSGSIFSLRPNGLTTNQVSTISAGIGGYATNADLRFTGALGVAGPVFVKLRAYIDASTTLGGVARWRTFEYYATAHYNVGTAYQTQYRSSAQWQETSTNLTSLNVIGSVAASILTGSQAMVFKTSKAFTV